MFMAEKLPKLLEIAVGGVDIDKRRRHARRPKARGVSNALNLRLRDAYGTIEGLASVLGLDTQEFEDPHMGLLAKPPHRRDQY